MGGNDSKRRRTAVVLRESKLGFKLVKKDEGLALVNAGATNVKIPKDGLLGLWTTDTQLKKNGDGFPYSLSMKTHIYDLEKEKKLALDIYPGRARDEVHLEVQGIPSRNPAQGFGEGRREEDLPI